MLSSKLKNFAQQLKSLEIMILFEIASMFFTKYTIKNKRISDPTLDVQILHIEKKES